MSEPSTNDSFPIYPTGPDGLLFEGSTYRYTFVSPLLESPDPMAIAQRTPVKGEGVPCRVILKRMPMPPEDERRQRTVEEVRLATRLHHPGSAEVYGRIERGNLTPSVPNLRRLCCVGSAWCCGWTPVPPWGSKWARRRHG